MVLRCTGVQVEKEETKPTRTERRDASLGLATAKQVFMYLGGERGRGAGDVGGVKLLNLRQTMRVTRQ